MQSNGSFNTPRGRRYVYAHLIDPGWLVQALDFPAPADVTPNGCVVKGQVGFGPLQGEIEIHLEIAERKDAQRAVYHGWGSGLGSQLTLSADFDLADTDGGGTHVSWSGAATINGPMSGVADTVFHPLSHRNFDHLQRWLEHDSATQSAEN